MARDALMLSGIQHFAFWPRQWALIHLEQQWQENKRAADGRVFHHRAHDGRDTKGTAMHCFCEDFRCFPMRWASV